MVCQIAKHVAGAEPVLPPKRQLILPHELRRPVPQGMRTIGRASRKSYSSGGGGGGGSPASYPSRWRVSDHHFVDENNVDLGIPKGFNWNCLGSGLPFAQSVFDDTAALLATATVPGPGLLRHVITWDTVEPSAGAFDGIASPLAAATAGSSFNKIDVSIQRAYAAGLYVYLDLHLLGGTADKRVPAWARTGTSPSGSGNGWSWYVTNGQAITQCLAQRYGNPATSPIGAAAEAVVGFCPNEPPGVAVAEMITGFQSIVPWWQTYAPLWPVWISPTSYGGGTPYPSGGAAIVVADLLALDTQDTGIAIDYRDYLINVGSASADGYQANGAIGPKEQVTNGAEYQGWGTPYNYANTAAARTAFAAHLAPLTTLRNQDPSIAICMMEWGIDNINDPAHDAYVKDKIDAMRAAGFTAEVWWQKGFGTTNFDSNHPAADDSYRPAISGSGWMLNATPRGNPQPPPPPTAPATVVGVGTLGVTPDSATASMTATGMALPAGVQAGDLMLMCCYFDTGDTTSGQSITPPAGWTQFVNLPSLAAGNILRVYCKVAGAGEANPASPTFAGATTGTSGGVGECQLVVLRGADTSALPASALAGVTGGNGFTNQQNMGAIAGFTPTADHALVFVFAGKKATWTSVATLTGDSLTWTEQFESPTTNASDAGMVLNTAPISGAPVAIANKTYTVTGGTTANGLGIMFAIKP